MNEQNLTESAYPCWLEEAHRDLYLDRLGLVLIQQARQAVCTCTGDRSLLLRGGLQGPFLEDTLGSSYVTHLVLTSHL